MAALLRNRNFTLLWVGQFISPVGDYRSGNTGFCADTAASPGTHLDCIERRMRCWFRRHQTNTGSAQYN